MAAQMEHERRFGRREAVQLRARVRTPAGRSVEVVLQDLSPRGCRFEKPEYEMIPDRFILKFHDGRPDMQAEVVWQIDNSVGAKFVEASKEFAPVQRAAPQIHKVSLSDLRRIAGRAG
ncbi:MAG: PilZ domain-containing protein [Rhodoblastus sp.]|nr:PilZ domain-containing protein [Rhodoblastus sp.]